MKLKEFSEKSVKAAEAANTLGFDCIEKYAVDKCGGRKCCTTLRTIPNW